MHNNKEDVGFKYTHTYILVHTCTMCTCLEPVTRENRGI